MDLIYATLGEHETAVQQFIAAPLSRQLPCRRVSTPYPPGALRFFSILSIPVTSNVGFRISCLAITIAPPKTSRKPCFIYEGISQCMQLELPIFILILFAHTTLVQ
jgi:hypothetical protein